MPESDPKKLGVITAMSYFMGNVVGAGIFITPTGILKYSGSIGLTLIIWTLYGLFSLMGTFCYIELGTSIPESGGDFAYLTKFNLQPLAFAFFWTTFAIYKPCSVAIRMKTFGTYIVEAFTLCLTSESKHAAVKLFGISLLLLLVWINVYQLTKHAAKVLVVVTVFKIVAIGIIMVSGMYVLIGDQSKFEDSMKGSKFSFDLIYAINSGLWSYDGWATLNFGVEDLDNPKRTLFLSATFGMAIVIIVYVGANVAYFAVLDVDEILYSTAVAQVQRIYTTCLTSCQLTIIADVRSKSFRTSFLRYAFYSWHCLLGGVNANLFATSRYYYAAARKGNMPSYMKLLHVIEGTPRRSLVTYVWVILPLIMVNSSTIEELIDYAAFVVWLQRVFTMAGLVWSRLRKWPVSDKAIQIPLVFHVLFLILVTCLVIVQTYRNLKATLIGCCIALFGLLIYFVVIWKSEKIPDVFKRFDYEVMKSCQILFYSIPEPPPSAAMSTVQQDRPVQNLLNLPKN